MLKHNTIGLQYFCFIPHHFSSELFCGENSGSGVGRKCTKGNEISRGKCPRSQLGRRTGKMLIMPSNLLNAKNLADVSCAKYFFPSPSEKAT